MSKKLTEFLTELATNQDLKDAFAADKAGTMKKHGVSDDDAKLVINKDYDAIQDKLGADYEISKNDIVRAFKAK